MTSTDGWLFEATDITATRRLGRELGRGAPAGCPLLLVGPLGAGKTTLVQGVAEGLDAQGRVASPTFVLIRSHSLGASAPGRSIAPYRSPEPRRRGLADLPEQLVHVDLYRASKMEAADLGLEEYIVSRSVVVVEWADRAPELFADGGLWVDIEIDDRPLADEDRALGAASSASRLHGVAAATARRFRFEARGPLAEQWLRDVRQRMEA